MDGLWAASVKKVFSKNRPGGNEFAELYHSVD
jgi:hypothetical protein